jgi:hypothetical protein
MIIICEPQCVGFEHVEANAALIAVVNSAFPNDKIIFLAEKEHIQYVNEKLKIHSIKGIGYFVINLPKRLLYVSIPGELRLYKKVFEFATERNVKRIIFCSITSPGLMSIKLLQRFFKDIECVVIPHCILETILTIPLFVVLPVWFRFSLSIANTDRLCYLVLGKFIEDELCLQLPSIKKITRSIDLPYFYNDPDKSASANDGIIRFGFFGVGRRNKGITLLFKMAQEIQTLKSKYNPKFILIGHIGNISFGNLLSRYVCVPSRDAPLSREEYDLYAKSIDYAVFFHNPDSYRLSTSAALFDAFSYLKPIIALRTPPIEYYFQKMGDIGYLCDSYEDMKSVILNILANGKSDRYIHQQDNILRGRKELCISKLGERIADMWDDKINVKKKNG